MLTFAKVLTLVDELVKGGSHKYISRKPTGNPRHPWRYLYTEPNQRAEYHKERAKYHKGQEAEETAAGDRSAARAHAIAADAHAAAARTHTKADASEEFKQGMTDTARKFSKEAESKSYPKKPPNGDETGDLATRRHIAKVHEIMSAMNTGTHQHDPKNWSKYQVEQKHREMFPEKYDD
jgi:phage protein D